MSNSKTNDERVSTASTPAAALKLEVVIIPVSDVDRAKHFYTSLGWRLDADFDNGSDWRVVQLTPPGSPTSIMIGKGLTKAAPGSARGTFLVVDDVAAARAELLRNDVTVSDVFHFQDNLLNVIETNRRLPGPDPEGRSYFSFASFEDPDENSWLLQEVKTRFPGRGVSSFDVPTLAELLQEAEKGHGEYTTTAPKHHWSGWYAAYIVARQQGQSPEQASKMGALHIEGVGHPRDPKSM
jgi:catechol 2,3-dioxygenase-like lactoylglutathione lyase family enzyme